MPCASASPILVFVVLVVILVHAVVAVCCCHASDAARVHDPYYHRNQAVRGLSRKQIRERECRDIETRTQTMHRQQRVRSSSRWSSLALPLSSAGSSIGTVSVSPRTRTSTSIPMSAVCARAGMSTSTVASSALLSQPLQPSQASQASQPSQTSLSSLFLPSSVSWSTSSLSSCSWGVQQTSCSRLSSLAGTKEAGIASTVSVNGIAWPRLVSVLAWSVTLLLVSSCIGLTDAGILNGHPLGKRSFIDIQCKGIYDKSIFARLDRICEDCYNLFREPQLHQLCRKNCFTSDYFKGCLDVLLLQDEVEKIQTWIKQLHGAEPGV